MADASKLRGLRRGGLGTPPPLDEARIDVARTAQEEHSAFVPQEQSDSEPTRLLRASTSVARPARLDGRTMRRSGRTVQFATRVSPEFDERVRQIAMRDGMLLVEVLEHALDAYEYRKKEAR